VLFYKSNAASATNAYGTPELLSARGLGYKYISSYFFMKTFDSKNSIIRDSNLRAYICTYDVTLCIHYSKQNFAEISFVVIHVVRADTSTVFGCFYLNMFTVHSIYIVWTTSRDTESTHYLSPLLFRYRNVKPMLLTGC
jgi:hypothetical protein